MNWSERGVVDHLEGTDIFHVIMKNSARSTTVAEQTEDAIDVKSDPLLDSLENGNYTKN